ncbi:wax ester synthase/diacylglycerol acyltransferase 11-like isoform X2 [Rhododendron vialii]|uniref:wax ester synthase/diacylglycerol acyltransferase 11-like isoform X2 n=1 Tax=Rhododendron vialii TaxID=182163 RepID=UPI00265D9F67|nr:wax ester synthase/diacylglycerol acyltransferase 11-like isoform X2 [Rhododendron vialii]
MGYSEVERDEPLSPLGRLFLTTDQIVHCIMGCENPIDVAAVTFEIANSVMIQLPRFSSLLVRDSHGREHWRKTQVDVPRHVIVVEDPVSDAADEEAVNDYVADLAVSVPLSSDKPLWEVHLLKAHNCIIFRIHHALGDGISLMSILQEWCQRAGEPDRRLSMGSMGTYSNSSSNRVKRRRALWKVVVGMLMGLCFIVQFVLRALWIKDKKTAVSGGAGVELWPRKLATAKFWLDDMKVVKIAVAEATINDVLIGVISSGLSRYLDLRSPRALQDGVQITGLAMVNLRKQSGLQELSDMMRGDSGIRWGNKFGMLLAPVYYHQGGANPLQYVKIAKQMMDQKKQSLEAQFSYNGEKCIMIYFGPQVASWLNYRIVCNTTFTISNVIGPKEEITIAGNTVKYLRLNNTSLPHAITMHMLSYAGRVDMQILVAKDIIPDPQVLAKCFEDALHQMKEAATKE